VARGRAMARNRKSPIDQVRWDGGNFFFGALTAGTSALVFTTAGSDTETLMRIRGELTIWVNGVQAPAQAAHIAVGLIVMPEGQSTTVVSSPITDDNAPWLMYEQFILGYEEYVVDVVDAPVLTAVRKTIDVKAQRILRPDREVQLVVENVTVSGAVGVNINFAARALFGQH